MDKKPKLPAWVKGDTQHAGRGPLIQYAAGFAFSILLTLMAYILVINQILPGIYMMLTIAGLAVIQLLILLLFFLRLGSGSKPRWKVLMFASALIVIGILAAGSLWIMNNPGYGMNTMPPAETDNYILHDEGAH